MVLLEQPFFDSALTISSSGLAKGTFAGSFDGSITSLLSRWPKKLPIGPSRRKVSKLNAMTDMLSFELWQEGSSYHERHDPNHNSWRGCGFVKRDWTIVSAHSRKGAAGS